MADAEKSSGREASMEKRNVGVVRLWRDHRLCALACIVMLSRCVLSLNEEGRLLLNWKQDSLKDPIYNLSNWNASDSTPCFWIGVNCTEGSVSALDFSPFFDLAGDIHALSFAKLANLTTLNVGSTGLGGNFPQDIVNCSKLVYVNLSGTHISGGVPVDIVNLQRLQVLDLSNAAFEGTIVSNIGELHELRVLRLGANSFEGPMPQSILSLTKLEELTLSSNNWNGTLPLGFFTIPNLKALGLGSNLDLLNTVPWPNFDLWENMEELRLEGVNFPPSLFPMEILKMTKIRILHLTRCNIMGPIPSLENLTHLEHLVLENNSLTGHIPNMFGSMPNLRILWLSMNQLTGPFPTSLWQCKKLLEIDAWQNNLQGNLAWVANLSSNINHLDIGYNSFSGEIPPTLGNLSQLHYLNINVNNLSGEIPLELGKLTLLTYLDLSWNFLTGELPSTLENLSHLTYLGVLNNSLHGEIPNAIGNLSLLTHLQLAYNNFSGKIPLEIGNLEALVDLHLRNNSLTGEIPYNLGKNSFIESIDLGINRLEGHIPPYLCSRDNVTLQYLALDGNRLIGSIPEMYGNCTNLGVLRLDKNQLEGPLPAGLWGGATLRRMHLNDNNLSGSIHANIGKAKNLAILYLQDNSFSDTIPPEIGQTSLTKFQANSNKLNGTLTPFLGNLSNLTQQILGDNSFNGTIPISLGNCTELVQLDLSRNHLEGTIPDEFGFLIQLSTLDLSENNLSGTIPRSLFNVFTLQTLNVAFNNLSGVIPNQRNGLTFVTVNFTGNPYLCMEGSCGVNASDVNLASKGDQIQSWIVIVGVFSAIALVLVVVLVLVFKRCSKIDSHEVVDGSGNGESRWTMTSFHNKVYENYEITALDEDNLIGAGGSGKVYKVKLNNGDIVAVKKLRNVAKDDESRDHGFGTELRTLANIRHRHIVKLLCCCTKRECNLLVYEYMPNGSLGDLLHGPKAKTLPWDIRYKIALGAATGLQYLHHECTPQILHRDVKSNNILVDAEYEARLADFGIARMVEPSASHDVSSIPGSLGYIPPEYSFDTRVTEKIDIYSFGVVLLELVTGKPAANPSQCEDGTNLVQWVHNRLEIPKGLCEIIDSKCAKSSYTNMLAFLQIAILCTEYKPTKRPSMRDVVKMLEDIASKSSMKRYSSNNGGDIDEGLRNLDVYVKG